MRGIGPPNPMKRAPRRSVSKGRCIQDLPLLLPVPAWMLIILLLLSSSVSLVQECGERACGEDAVGTYDNYVDINIGSHESIHEQGLGSPEDVSSSSQKEGNKHVRNHRGSGTSVALEDEDEEVGVVERLNLSPDVLLSTGSLIDALQYAEYGAGLLQKSGAAEESSKVCLVGTPATIQCPVLVDQEASVGLECSMSYGNWPCTNEFLVPENCKIMQNYEGKSVEVRPGQHYFHCREDLARAVSCEVACCSSTQCFQSAVDSKTCHCDRSLANWFLRSPGIYTKQNLRIAVPSVDDEIKNEAERDSSSYSPSPIETLQTTDIWTAVTSDHLQPNDLSLQEAIVMSSQHETHLDQAGDAMLSRQDECKVELTTEELMEPLMERNGHSGAQNDRGEGGGLSLTEASIDSHVALVNSPQLGLGALRLDVDEGLLEEVQSMLQEEGPLTLKSPASTAVQDEKQVEPVVKLRRVGSVMSLDEYKRSILAKQQKLGSDMNLSSVQTHKMRHSDESYNYAASSNGAKVLGSNKESKGASHIINSDKDKYLRNPCSAADKYVVLELSEETFVDTVVVSNFEFHSANLKDFEVFGSPLYPTKEWILLGKFQAENVRIRQKFTIDDPKLVRYLMFKMLSHWGSEFFCTLSAVEVFGVDVIKNLLDDWIASEEGETGARTQVNGPSIQQEESTTELLQVPLPSLEATLIDSLPTQTSAELASSVDSVASVNKEKKVDASPREEDGKAGDSVTEVHHLPGRKPPGDSVLKILMQRVKALELNQSLFDNYLEDMNTKYKAMLSELDKDLALISARVRNETAVSALLALRLTELETKRKEERAYFEQKFASIASNFTENMEFMRWQIQSMERREITAVVLALFCMILSALLHLLARCLPPRVPSTQEYTGSMGEKSSQQVDACSLYSACQLSSSAVLYLASALTILVLSV